MKKTFGFGILAAGILFVGVSAWADEGGTAASATPMASQPTVVSTPATKVKKAKKSKKAAKEVWVCPMGDYKGPKTADGKCPTCGMDLVQSK